MKVARVPSRCLSAAILGRVQEAVSPLAEGGLGPTLENF